MSSCRTALLRGRDHVIVGARGVVAEGDAAIAISRGGAPKRYDYTDPNEDAAGFARGEGGVVVAVADGHFGYYGAEHAVAHLLERFAPDWTGAGRPHADDDAWLRAGLEALVAINNAVLAEAERRSLPDAPTTLSLAVVRPDEGRMVVASAGDSHVFRVDEESRATDLGWAAARSRRAYFLGSRPHTVESFGDKCRVACEPLQAARALVLATDGLSERGIGAPDPDRAVSESVLEASREDAEEPALRACKAVLTRAQAAQRAHDSGDNIAVAVAWL